MSNNVRTLLLVLIIILIAAGAFGWFILKTGFGISGVRSPIRDQRVLDWMQHPEDHPDWRLQSGQRCGSAPFQMPTDGFIGYLWDDSWRPGHRHQGIDIFGGTQPGITPVYAAADGYLSRLADWKASLIIRLPKDPLRADRQIWTYYTHLADAEGNSLISPDFPPGVEEVPVKAGTLLGRQGNFSGTPGSPVGVHLHFSIVLDDGKGRFRNELNINNTLDPSPYFGMNLNAHKNVDEIPLCPAGAEGGY